MIPGGYYLKARATQDSEINRCPPHIREVWDWLLLTASHEDNKYCERGQVICNYARMQEDLSWYIGWRKQTYSYNQIAQAMKTIRHLGMITTTKTTRNTIVTILNYSRYQDPKNYTNARREVTTNTDTKHIRSTTLYNKEKEVINNTSNVELEELIQRTYNYYIKVFNKNPNQYKLTKARKDKIRLRIKDLGIDNLKNAIKNTATSAWHNGDSDSGWKADLDWIIKSHERAEKQAFMNDANGSTLSKHEQAIADAKQKL